MTKAVGEETPRFLGWINLYQHTFVASVVAGRLMSTRKEADDAATATASIYTRIACIEAFEGEGL